ncbi:hypothetical protein [Ileibacterium valens]|uniref:hypothetical protein n=2 Tax=Ileibacterium valens TaxID=1862668 RepID=UPI002570DF4B|nr:hypothetical protein [Ileibacterium valens]
MKKRIKKIESGILCSLLLGTSLFCKGVRAEENTVINQPTMSGDPYIGVLDTHKKQKCVGIKDLTGMDAVVFAEVMERMNLTEQISMNADGSGKESHEELVCVQSNGFTTDVTKLTQEVDGSQSPILSTHWTVWFKNHKDDEIDKSLDHGNYFGFNQSKTSSWLEFEEQIKKINGGLIPENRKYSYPMDTTGAKTIDFWSDIPGYYDVLGDPKYAGMKLESTQYFSYKTKKTSVTYTVEVVPESDHSKLGLGSGSYGSGSGSLGMPSIPSVPWYGPYSTGGKGGFGNNNGSPSSVDVTQNELVERCSKSWWGRAACVFNGSMTKIGAGLESMFAFGDKQKISNANAKSRYGDAMLAYAYDRDKENFSDVRDLIKNSSHGQMYGNIINEDGSLRTNQDGKLIGSKEVPKTDIIGHDKENSVCKPEGYLQTGDTVSKVTSCTKISYSDHYDSVKVASAVVGVGAYATQIAGFEPISLSAGNEGTLEGRIERTPFWGKAIPYYWENEGRYLIENDSTLYYHYDIQSNVGQGDNYVNPYGAIVSAPDRLFPLINGNADITQIPGFTKNDYPSDVPRVCIEVDNVETCATAKTPLTGITLDITDGKNPQELIEAEKFIHHVDYYDSKERDEIDNAEN